MPSKDIAPIDQIRPAYYRVSPGSSGDRRGAMGIEELLGVLWQSKARLSLYLILAALFAILYLLMTPPVYRADALLQIEPQDSGLSMIPGSQEPARSRSTPVEPQLLMIKSRTTLGHVVDELNLDTIVRPERAPVVGAALARWYPGPGPAKPLFGLKRYAWGGENISVAQLEVPQADRGRTFHLIAGREGTYKLYDDNETLIGSGRVGSPLTASLGGDQTLKLLVNSLQARPGTAFTLVRQVRLSTIDALEHRLNVAQEGDNSGMIRVSLDGKNRKRITQIVQAVADAYRQQSEDRASGEVNKTLSFIENQLALVKARLAKAQANLKDWQEKKGAVDLPAETQSVLQQTVDLEAELAKLKRQRAIFLQRHTAKHPEVASLNFKISEINKELVNEERKVRRLPAAQQEVARLQREVGVRSTLYEQLLSKAEELKVVKNGPQGRVRIIDPAAASVTPVRPRETLVLLGALLVGLALGGASAVYRKIRDDSIEDPDTIESHLGLPVYAAVPLSRQQRAVKRRRRRNGRSSILAGSAPHDVTVEALRSLRTTLRVARIGASNNALLVTSPAASAGKSFVAANLAAVYATANRRVLLIDADMRTGELDKDFGIQVKAGLSNILAGTVRSPRETIYPTDVEGLFLLPAGDIPHNPAELLIGMRFKRVLKYLMAYYDEVIIDSPPVLPVTDAAAVSHIVGTTVLVVRDGVTPLRDLDESVRRLSQAGANLRGVVFNAQRKRPRRYGYGYGSPVRYNTATHPHATS